MPKYTKFVELLREEAENNETLSESVRGAFAQAADIIEQQESIISKLKIIIDKLVNTTEILFGFTQGMKPERWDETMTRLKDGLENKI